MDKLILYFQYPFVRYAMIVGVLIAMCSETFFIYWRRTFPCGIWSDGGGGSIKFYK